MNLSPYDLLMDFAIMSILLFIAQLLRSKLVVFQKLLLPSSLVAGFFGLFLGPEFLNILPFSSAISSYAYLLVVFLFASLFIGNEGGGSFKQTMDEVGDTFLLNSGVYFGQYAAALLIGGGLIMLLFPQVPEAFAILMPGGFMGGHGTAAAFGGSFKELIDWDEALPIGQTFATIGLLVGVIGGVIAINIATRVKATRFITTMAELPEGMRTGMLPQNEQESMGRSTVSPMTLDPLTWHLMLVLIATCAGYYLTNWLQGLFPSLSIPMFSVAMICGVLLQMVLKALKLTKYVDKNVVTRIGSSATDYLVAFGIASIKISVVLKYLYPIIILTLVGIASVTFYLVMISRKLFHNFWFERGIFIFGWSTGVVAIGVTLLRIVDPEFKSKTLEDYGMAYVFMSFIEIGLIAILPTIIVKGYGMLAGGVCFIIFLIILGICAKKYGLFKGKAGDLRPGEAEILGKCL